MFHLNHIYKKIKNTFVGNAEDFDIVMPMYNLSEYSNNHYMTSRRSWNYYRQEVNDAVNEIVAHRRINNRKTPTSKFLSIRQK